MSVDRVTEWSMCLDETSKKTSAMVRVDGIVYGIGFKWPLDHPSGEQYDKYIRALNNTVYQIVNVVPKDMRTAFLKECGVDVLS